MIKSLHRIQISQTINKLYAKYSKYALFDKILNSETIKK